MKNFISITPNALFISITHARQSTHIDIRFRISPATFSRAYFFFNRKRTVESFRTRVFSIYIYFCIEEVEIFVCDTARTAAAQCVILYRRGPFIRGTLSLPNLRPFANGIFANGLLSRFLHGALPRKSEVNAFYPDKGKSTVLLGPGGFSGRGLCILRSGPGEGSL